MPMNDDDRKANARVAAALGDDLSCWDKDGKVVKDDGYGWDRLWYAVDSWDWNIGDWYMIIRNVYDLDQTPNIKSVSQWAYDNRDGQPWQSDIETHVAAWRADPPDYVNDIALCMTELWSRLVAIDGEARLTGWNDGAGVRHVCRVNIEPVGYGFKVVEKYADTAARAVVAAFLATAEGGKAGGELDAKDV